MDEQAAERRALADGTRLIRQEHDYGCGIASLAMCCGMTYEQVRTWLIGNWPKGSQTPDEWLTKRGIHKGIADYFLAGQGYVWRTVYSGWGQEPWPPEPFAPVHLAQVVQPSNNSHYVVMRADGVVLDPLSDEPKRLTDWEKVNNVQGVWPNPADRLAAAEERDRLRAEVERLRGEAWDDAQRMMAEQLDDPDFARHYASAHMAREFERERDHALALLDQVWAVIREALPEAIGHNTLPEIVAGIARQRDGQHEMKDHLADTARRLTNERDAAVSRAEAAEAAVERVRRWAAPLAKRRGGWDHEIGSEVLALLAPQPAHDGPERPREATNTPDPQSTGTATAPEPVSDECDEECCR